MTSTPPSPSPHDLNPHLFVNQNETIEPNQNNPLESSASTRLYYVDDNDNDDEDTTSSSSSTTSSNYWPTEASKRTKLYYPSNNISTNKSKIVEVTTTNENDTYILQYDDRRSIIRIVHESTGGTVDSFSPVEDVIGAELQIKFQDSAVTTETTTTTKENENENENEEVTDGGDNGEEPPPLEKTTTTTNQMAYLNIYCYPRAPSSPSILTKVARCFGPSSSTTRTRNCCLDDDAVDDEANKKKMGHRTQHHRHLLLAPCFDFSDARSLVRAIRRLAKLGHYLPQPQPQLPLPTIDTKEETSNPSTPPPPPPSSTPIPHSLRPHRYLVIINPYSGTKTAHTTYTNTVQPMLTECGIEHDVFITRHAGHASQRMRTEYPSLLNNNNQGVASLSSLYGEEEGVDTAGLVRDVADYDGIVAMGGDGILYEMLQTLWEREDAECLMARMKFGIVGCGTSNGLVAGLLYDCGEKYDALEATFLICKGNTSKMDLSRYQTQTKKYISFLTFSWAMIADIDIESECIRFAGVLRNDIWGAWRVLNLKRYRARFSYLSPPPSYNDDNNNVQKVEVNQDNLTSLWEPVPSSWKTMEEDFILFWACQQTHAASNTHQSPGSKLDDGIFRILIIREPCPRLELAKIMIGLENASHVSSKNAEVIKCVAFRLQPLSPGSCNDLDGEVIEAGPVQAHVMPSAMNIFHR